MENPPPPPNVFFYVFLILFIPVDMEHLIMELREHYLGFVPSEEAYYRPIQNSLTLIAETTYLDRSVLLPSITCNSR